MLYNTSYVRLCDTRYVMLYNMILLCYITHDVYVI